VQRVVPAVMELRPRFAVAARRYAAGEAGCLPGAALMTLRLMGNRDYYLASRCTGSLLGHKHLTAAPLPNDVAWFFFLPHL
jgi:hypothetical protein